MKNIYDKMIRLSIILPAYNVEKYIERCIRSLYCQELALAEYEVIVVDDGSPDNLHEIVKNLQKEFENLILIRQENKHVGGARNTGIREAKGEYILFVDPDDYILPNTLLYLLNRMKEEDLDVLRTEFAFATPEKVTLTLTGKDSPVLPGNIFFKKYGVDHSACVHVIRKNLLTGNNILFREKTPREDGDFMSKVTFFAKRIQHISFIFYVYFTREDSITHTAKIETFIADILMIQVINDFNESVVKQKDGEAYKIFQRGIEQSIRSFAKLSLNYSLRDIITIFKTIQEIRLLETLHPVCFMDKANKLLIIHFPFLYSVSLQLLKIPVWVYRLRFKFLK